MAVLSRLALLPLLALPAPALARSLTPDQVGQIFCFGRLSDDMAPVQAILAPALSSAISTALEKNDAIQKSAPDEKPPLGDGIPWQSYPDYAPTCSVAGIGGTPESPQVTIAYHFPDQPDGDWSDRLELVAIDGRLRINDVIYKDGGRLARVLAEAFAP